MLRISMFIENTLVQNESLESTPSILESGRYRQARY